MGHNVTKDANGRRITFEAVDELYQFLQGVEVEHGIKCKDMPHLSPSEAFSVIYFLQEQLEVLPDWAEQCENCETLLDAESEGHYGEGIGHYCDSCTSECECADCKELESEASE